MEQNFTKIAEKVKQRSLAVIKALEEESKSLSLVEQTLNKRYQESVTNVLNSLTNSMEEQENERIKHKLNESLTLMDEIISASIANNEKHLIQMKQNVKHSTQEVSESFKMLSEQSQVLTKIKAKQWIIPTVMGLSIVTALALGTWGTTKYLDTQLQTLVEIHQDIEAQKKQIKWGSTYNNAIVLKPNTIATIGTTEDGKKAVFFKVEE